MAGIKSNALLCLGELVLFFLVINMLLEYSGNTGILITGITALYILSFLFIFYLERLLQEEDKGILYILGILFPYYFQKHEYVFGEIMKQEKIVFYTNMVLIFIFSCIAFHYALRKYRTSWKNFISLENIRNYSLYISIFYVFRAKSIEIRGFFITITIATFLYHKEWKNFGACKYKKNIFILLLFFLASCFFSDSMTSIVPFEEDLLRDFSRSYLLFAVVCLIPISKKILQKIELTIGISCIFPILLILLEWKQKNYILLEAMGEDEYSSIWAVRAVLIALVLLFLFFKRKQSIFLGLFAFSIVTLLAAQGRGPLLSFIISSIFVFSYFANREHKRKYLIFGVASLCVVIMILFSNENYIMNKFQRAFAGTDYSTNTRFILYKDAIQQWELKKLYGHGLGTFHNIAGELKQEAMYEKGIVHSHNNFLELLRSVGVLGLLSYIVLNWYIFISLWKKYKKEKVLFALLPMFLMVSFELSGLTDYTLSMTKSHLLILILSAIALSYQDETTKRISISEKTELM